MYKVTGCSFRRNLERVGEVMAYEISKTFPYAPQTIQTPINPVTVMLAEQDVVIATVFKGWFAVPSRISQLF